MALRTTFGKKVGNVLTAGGDLNPINDLAKAIGQLTGSIVSPTPNKYNARNEAIIAAAKKKDKAKVTINHIKKVSFGI
jgi:hypothetical protein